MENTKSNESNESNRSGIGGKKGLIALAVLLVAVLAVFVVWRMNRPAVSDGDKHIVVEVVDVDGKSKEYEYDTDEEYLRDVLESAGLISGEESEYGLFVKTVDGYTASDTNQEWWYFSKGGEMLMTGVDTTPVADGDHFEITLKVGYDDFSE